MQNQPHFSPDGLWWWNGSEWRPAAEYHAQPPAAAPAPTYVVVEQRGGPWRWLLACGVIVLLAVVGMGVCFSAVGDAVSKSVAQSESNVGNCSPKPCANDDGFIVYVQGVQWQYRPADPSITPEPGNQFARVTVSFSNASGGEKHADPFQFVLKDEQGVKHSLALTGASWSAVNLTPGSRLGPKDLDFQVSQGTAKGTLVWTPTFHDRSIPLA